MQKIVVLILIGFFGWYGYGKYKYRQEPVLDMHQQVVPETASPTAIKTATDNQFKCDSRTYCSQMTSCGEAMYFLKNCPGTKMDGNGDGVPCERQWCK
jgi:hypothetical protein